MAPHVPGLLTRIIPATVRPRKASSERRRVAPVARLWPPPALPARARAPSASSRTPDSYSPTVMLI
ncbi:MAG: hypothetical protein LC795_03875 [Acidobacteria bacterium]|nr:hypothetical protein [Acidobacteriota bacterium]